MHTHSIQCIHCGKYLGDSNSERKATATDRAFCLSGFLQSTKKKKRGQKEKKEERKRSKKKKARILVKVLRKHTWRVKDWSRRGVTYDRLSQ